jgi:predicted alpha/beta hydrolase family esterase
MKRAALFHGTGATPNDFWYPWLCSELRANGFDVWAPQLPDADRADLSVLTPYVTAHGGNLNDATLIGHSAGVPLVLNLLQQGNVRIRRALLVAGFGRALAEMPEDHQTLLRNPDWDKMKAACEEFYFIHSDNDPWGCDHHQGEYLRQKLGGTLIVKSGHGHFGSNVFNQPYPDFPLLKALALLPLDTLR